MEQLQQPYPMSTSRASSSSSFRRQRLLDKMRTTLSHSSDVSTAEETKSTDPRDESFDSLFSSTTGISSTGHSPVSLGSIMNDLYRSEKDTLDEEDDLFAGYNQQHSQKKFRSTKSASFSSPWGFDAVPEDAEATSFDKNDESLNRPNSTTTTTTTTTTTLANRMHLTLPASCFQGAASTDASDYPLRRNSFQAFACFGGPKRNEEDFVVGAASRDSTSVDFENDLNLMTPAPLQKQDTLKWDNRRNRVAPEVDQREQRPKLQLFRACITPSRDEDSAVDFSPGMYAPPLTQEDEASTKSKKMRRFARGLQRLATCNPLRLPPPLEQDQNEDVDYVCDDTFDMENLNSLSREDANDQLGVVQNVFADSNAFQILPQDEQDAAPFALAETKKAVFSKDGSSSMSFPFDERDRAAGEASAAVFNHGTSSIRQESSSRRPDREASTAFRDTRFNHGRNQQELTSNDQADREVSAAFRNTLFNQTGKQQECTAAAPRSILKKGAKYTAHLDPEYSDSFSTQQETSSSERPESEVSAAFHNAGFNQANTQHELTTAAPRFMKGDKARAPLAPDPGYSDSHPVFDVFDSASTSSSAVMRASVDKLPSLGNGKVVVTVTETEPAETRKIQRMNPRSSASDDKLTMQALADTSAGRFDFPKDYRENDAASRDSSTNSTLSDFDSEDDESVYGEFEDFDDFDALNPSFLLKPLTKMFTKKIKKLGKATPEDDFSTHNRSSYASICETTRDNDDDNDASGSSDDISIRVHAPMPVPMEIQMNSKGREEVSVLQPPSKPIPQSICALEVDRPISPMDEEESSQNTFKPLPCACGRPKECAGISAAFFMLNDDRAGYIQVPEYRKNAMSQFDLETNRLRRALLRPFGGAGRGVGEETQHLYVANHHFHPGIISSQSSKGSTNVLPMYVSETATTSLDLDLKDQDRVVDKDGKPTGFYYVVPNYSVERTKQDLKKAIKVWRNEIDDEKRANKELIQNLKQEEDLSFSASFENMLTSRNPAGLAWYDRI